MCPMMVSFYFRPGQSRSGRVWGGSSLLLCVTTLYNTNTCIVLHLVTLASKVSLPECSINSRGFQPGGDITPSSPCFLYPLFLSLPEYFFCTPPNPLNRNRVESATSYGEANGERYPSSPLLPPSSPLDHTNLTPPTSTPNSKNPIPPKPTTRLPPSAPEPHLFLLLLLLLLRCHQKNRPRSRRQEASTKA